MPLKDDPQHGLWDREVADDAIEEYAETILQNRDAARAHGSAKRRLKKHLTKIGVALKDGERVRVGRYVLTGKAYEGGGIHIDYWSVVTPALSAID